MERTLILVKPDAFARGLTGEIIARFERKGLRIVALEHRRLDREIAQRHYAEHEGKPFFGELVEFITSGALVAMVLEGHEAVTAARQVIGATNPLEAAPGSIRVDTVVALDGVIYGKPADEAEAAATLRALSGATHQVISGIALARDGDTRTASAVTDVTFRTLSEAQVAWYVAVEEWRERAGGYAIQGRGAALVRGISGDYLNVVGLPAATLLDLLGW